MSDCPFGRQAVEALKEVADNFGDNIDYEVHYIASEDGDGFRSLHGQYEVDENIIQLCVNEHSPEQWLDYMYCRSTKGVKGIDWKECAEETGVDVDAVQECFDGEEGEELLRQDIKIANSMGVSASPTWLANNRYKFSGIDAETVKSNVCRYNPDIDGCENVLTSTTGGLSSGSCWAINIYTKAFSFFLMRYNKLVRDRIPEILKQKGITPVTRIASDEEYWEKLKEKLIEEVNEFKEKETEEELADILEVINAIADFKKIEKEKLETLRKNKAEKRGAFKDKVILNETK